MFDASNADLQQIPVDKIVRNKDNPRLVFRPGELEDLLESIRIHGVQVPISVFVDESKNYVLIDGERRWRCCLKLNKAKIPALIQPKPDKLDNLLLMFNIHSTREQWDLLTIAMKLPKVITLLKKRLKKNPTEKELSEQTGLNRSIIRRSKLLMEIPEKYRSEILEELNKPKAQQKITEDLFIELEKGLKTVERALPEVLADKDAVRDILVNKFKSGVIRNRVHFRYLGKIARAHIVGIDKKVSARELKKVFSDNRYSLEEAFNNSAGAAYLERDVGSRAKALTELLDDLSPGDIDDAIRVELKHLEKRLRTLLGA